MFVEGHNKNNIDRAILDTIIIIIVTNIIIATFICRLR